MSSNRAATHEISTNLTSPDPMPTDMGSNSKQDSQVDLEKADYDGEPKVLEATAVPTLDPIREKKLTRKLDLYLIPIFCVGRRSISWHVDRQLSANSFSTSCVFSIGPTLVTPMSPSHPSLNRSA